jgi:DNA polymerase-3 subunit alpha
MEYIDEFVDRKFGVKEIKYSHPALEEILKETYGIIVYQEQVIQIANKIGGMSLAEADNLRRAIGKKDLVAMKQQKDKFISGAQARGIDKKIAIQIFETIDKFANYGFNKSHAVAYSYIAYQTAYLKAHYTPEFLAANLTNEFGESDKVTKYLEDCRKLKIEVLPPDVNNPSVDFDVVDGKIRFGLSAIKNVGKIAVQEIIKSRKKIGRDFAGIFDFCMNVDTRIVNKRALEGLVVAGAFDSLEKNRASLFKAVESALEFGHKVQNSKLASTSNLFADTDDIKISEPKLPYSEPWTDKERLARERVVVGFYISNHPLIKYNIEYKSFTNFHIGESENLEDKQEVRACGIITNVKTKIDRSGKKMAFFKMDDLSGSCECLMFSKIYADCGKYLIEEEPVYLVGLIESSGDAVKIHVDKLIPIEAAREQLTQSLKITVNKETVPPENLYKLKSILEKNSGKFPVYLSLTSNGSKNIIYSLDQYRISLNSNLLKSLTDLFGEDSVLLFTK